MTALEVQELVAYLALFTFSLISWVFGASVPKEFASPKKWERGLALLLTLTMRLCFPFVAALVLGLCFSLVTEKSFEEAGLGSAVTLLTMTIIGDAYGRWLTK